MRRTMLAMLLPTITALAVVVPGATAQATTYVCPKEGTSPSFIIDRRVLVDTETTVSVPNGTMLPGGIIANNATLTTGRFVEQFTNDTTGKTIAPAENGPNWFTFDLTPNPQGAVASGTAVDTGNNVSLFGPASEAALQAAGIHVPVLSFTSGLLLLHVVFPPSGAPYVNSFSLRGNLVDGCALLR
jgi:hypothetical protein